MAWEQVAAITLWLPLRKASRLEGASGDDGDEFPPPQPASNNNQKVNSAVVEIALIISFPEK
jgi:hypothetical protein